MSIEEMVLKAKVARAPRRVWRMTAENQLGEILELVPPAPGPGDRGGRSQDARASAGASVASLSSPSSPTSSASNGAAFLCTPGGLTFDPAPVSWRASSYDLLHGLRVHDVTDTIPARMFDALFSPDPGAMPPSTSKRR